MTDESQVNQLLDEWEELRESNPRLSRHQFIKDRLAGADKELIKAFRYQAEQLAWIDRQMEQVAGPPPTANQAPKWNDDDLGISALRAGLEPIRGYTLVNRLGAGGFGEVWKAESPGGFHVALKFVQISGRVGEVEERSLEVIKDVRHPHLLSVFGTWRIGDLLIIATELADRTLLDRLQEAQKEGHDGIPRDELLVYLAEAAKGIDFLNDPGKSGRMRIQHRDIKPQNLLLSGGSVKVGDFGLARSIHDDVTAHTGGLTFAYAAPECFDGTTSNSVDQYSLAITYCHLRGGRLPFDGTQVEIMEGHRKKQPDLSMITEEERPAVVKALAKFPKDRWASCRAFARELIKATRGKQVAGDIAPRTAPIPPPIPRPITPPPVAMVETVTKQTTEDYTAFLGNTHGTHGFPTVHPRKERRKRKPRPALLFVAFVMTGSLLTSMFLIFNDSDHAEVSIDVGPTDGATSTAEPTTPHRPPAAAPQEQSALSENQPPMSGSTPQASDLASDVIPSDLISDGGPESDSAARKVIETESTDVPADQVDRVLEWHPKLSESTYGTLFQDLPEGNLLLVGMEVTTGRFGINYRYNAIASIKPVYRTPSGTIQKGRRYGYSGSGTKEFLARDGYAIGAIKLAYSSPRIVGIQFQFMRVIDGRLDPADAYWSQNYLRTADTKATGGDGSPIVGVSGRYAKQEMRELAFATLTIMHE